MENKPRVVMMLGAPGAGKGTQGSRLASRAGIAHISTGDEIRKILKGDVPDSFDKSLINEIRTICAAGGLIDD